MSPAASFVSTRVDPYGRGQEFGEAQAAPMATTVAAYAGLFERLAPGFDLDHWGGRAWRSIEDLAPRAAAEIAGLAAGAGIPVEHVAALNARTELLAIAAPDGAEIPSECSTVVSTAEGRAPIAVQTWDWYADMRDNWLRWTISLPDGGRIHTLTEYGVLAKIGVNDDGFGVMLNMLHHDADDQRPAGDEAQVGFPVHVLLRTLLEECGTAAQARKLAAVQTYSASSAVTVVDRGGDAVSLETFPEGVGQVPLVDDLLVRTNHFVSAEGEPGCQGGRLDRNSWVRRDHLLSELGERPPVTVRDVYAAMRHHGPDGSVCRHPDDFDPDPTATLATVALDVGRGRLTAWAGGPCTVPG